MQNLCAHVDRVQHYNSRAGRLSLHEGEGDKREYYIAFLPALTFVSFLQTTAQEATVTD